MSISYARMLLLAVRAHTRANGKTGRPEPAPAIADCSKCNGEQHSSATRDGEDAAPERPPPVMLRTIDQN